jgi:hypothetical protein
MAARRSCDPRFCLCDERALPTFSAIGKGESN